MSEQSLSMTSPYQNIGEIFTYSIMKRQKIEKPLLVDGRDKLAEQVQPGYLVKLAEEIERANDFVHHSACGRLKVIEDQMKLLKQQAANILIETKINSILHSLPCNFPKKVGSIYSVYKKPNCEYYFSMLSPQEWGSAPHEYVGSFKLEGGMSWIPIDKFSEMSAMECWVLHQTQEPMMIE